MLKQRGRRLFWASSVASHQPEGEDQRRLSWQVGLQRPSAEWLDQDSLGLWPASSRRRASGAVSLLAGSSRTTESGLSGQSGELVVTSKPERCCLKAREASHEASPSRSVPGFGLRASPAPRSAESPRGKTARLG
jgi:hypothetical protein